MNKLKLINDIDQFSYVFFKLGILDKYEEVNQFCSLRDYWANILKYNLNR